MDENIQQLYSSNNYYYKCAQFTGQNNSFSKSMVTLIILELQEHLTTANNQIDIVIS